MNIIMEVFLRAYERENVLDDMFMIMQYLRQSVSMKVISRHKIEIFTERQPPKIIAFDNIMEFWVFFFEPHHTATREYNLQIRIGIITFAKLYAPIRLLEYLVYQQYFSSVVDKVPGEFCNTFTLEIKVVHVDIEASPIVCAKLFLGILQQKCGLSYTACPFNANHATVPVNLIHKGATY